MVQYNPATGTFVATGSMSYPRANNSATLLSDGQVLIAGGNTDRSCQLFDPATGKFSPTGSLKTWRDNATATLLQDGRVLVAGGDQGDIGPGQLMLASAEIYDPATGRFSPTGSMAAARTHHTATLLPDGRVLIAGGYEVDHGLLSSAEIYDPATGRFTPTGSMADARNYATATLLADGRVLIVGGNVGPNTTAEIYDPASGTFSPTGSLVTERSGSATALLHDGRVLVVGGSHEQIGALTSAEVYWP